ncbi:hypothetical protein SOCE26_027650 [Sorangium cellulosum]|uniref:DUF4340 domain-containing protein n=1 Tax=Sorangium cellulosum TaxID=56 RepID=A0A2L0EPY9_SORCE|nr:DUF4340 domain-containing protein [Sorangium cellulosum]AUX41354.1 hypothetical protein SOCE26_027650 [Sorangium cellulosum]
MRRALRRHATTLVLVALAAAAAIALFVLDRRVVPTEEAERRKKNLFEAWRPDDITELTVTMSPPGAPPGAQQTARITRGEVNDAGQRPWSVEIDGQRHPADEPTVDQYLGTLEFATAERRVSAEASDPAALGLTAPRLAVAIAMGARRERLLLGGGAPTPPGAVYAEVAGRGVFVITQQLAAALEVPPDRFRSRSFIPYAAAELSGLELAGEGGPRRFVRAPWGGGRGAGFRFAEGSPEGSGVRVSASTLERVLSALGRMQAETFLSEEEAQRAAASGGPRVTLTLLPSDPSAGRGVIDLGGPCPGKPDHVVALRREPTRAAACVPASALDPLTEEAPRFVDLALVGAPLDEVAEVKLAVGPRGERSLELARAGSEWHLRAPEDRPVPTEAGRALVQAILDVRAARLLPAASDLAALGLDPPRATLRVVSTPAAAGEGEPQERVETLEIGAEQAGVVHVRRIEDGALAALPAASAGALLPTEVSLRPVQVLDFPPDQVDALRIERAGLVQRLRRAEGGAWQLVEPRGEGLAADSGLAEELAELLGSLKAERWVAAAPGASYGLGAPRLAIEAELAAAPASSGAASEAAPRTVRVELGARAGDGSFARAGDGAFPRAGDGAAVFIAPPALEAAAGRLLLRRDVFLVPPHEIARVALARGDGREPPLVIEASPGGFTVPGAADEAGATATAASVRDALADLRAEGAVALGKPEKHHGLSPPRLRITVELTRSEAAPGVAVGTPPRPRGGSFTIAIGAGDSFRGTNVVYARRDGVDAVYAIARSRVRPLLDAAGLASAD